MDTSDEERLAALEAAFATVKVAPIGSTEELARSEQARAARHFGFAQPGFRTSVQLRFSGEGVKGHDLNGSIAGSVIAGFTGSVDAAGTQLHLAPGSTTLFLSPNVTPGSTALEMFSAPVSGEERLDLEIDDTPVDQALDKLFAILGEVINAGADTAAMPEIEGSLGKRLFALAKNLIDGDVDLDLAWTRPRGSSRVTNLSRVTARALRDHLDVDSTTSTERRDRGTLASVSTAGVIGFTPDNRKTAISIAAPDSDTEALRLLWARPVEVVWTETVVSHPQRDDKKVTNQLLSIREATADDELTGSENAASSDGE
jgi:hypothetical protein